MKQRGSGTRDEALGPSVPACFRRQWRRGRRARQISLEANQGGCAVRAGQRHRYRHAHRRRAHAADSRPAGGDRKQTRRLRHPCDRGNGAFETRRLYAANRQSRHQCARAHHLQEEIQDRLRQRGHLGDEVSEVPLVLGATTKDFPPKTYAEFVAYAKANPGKVRYASVGIGSNNHYDMEAFAQWAGIVLAHLPNKGGGAAITNDLVTGDAHVALLNAASSMGVVKAGQVRALAVMSDQRVPEYADVPTLTELGYANAKGLWSALYAPAATPRDVLEIVRKAAVQALDSEPVTTAFKQQMIRPLPSASSEEA